MRSEHVSLFSDAVVSRTLAAVINHLESESCDYMHFEAVQKNVERILDPRRMIQA